jgi:hypothetical protein
MTDGSVSTGDQVCLQAAGLLSLEQVLLPAVAGQEDEALKLLHAKTQHHAGCSPRHLSHGASEWRLRKQVGRDG